MIMYKIKRDGILLCTQPMENKNDFISMANTRGYKIYLDDKDVTNKYKNKKVKIRMTSI